MKTIGKKLAMIGMLATCMFGMTVVPQAKADTILLLGGDTDWICYLMGCDATTCYYACQPFLGG